jgi:hypothetical protein
LNAPKSAKFESNPVLPFDATAPKASDDLQKRAKTFLTWASQLGHLPVGATERVSTGAGLSEWSFRR